MPSPKWAEVANELDTLLDEGALGVARDNLDTSFFTPPAIITAVFDLLRATGFTGGRVLEPGCGSGRFMAHTPADLNIRWTGVDIDTASSRMAELLNPGATIINAPMQDTTFVTGQFDAVIGNVPFSSATVYDVAFSSGSLHEYFLRRSIDAVREGGYVIAVTSRFSIDAQYGFGHLLRDSDGAAQIADFIGAVRLPSGAFASEGTDVVTDIILIRKRAHGEPSYNWTAPADESSTNYYGYGSRPTHTYRISESVNDKPATAAEVSLYWKHNPEHVAGTMKVNGNYRNPLVVVAADKTTAIASAVAAAASKLVPQTEGDTYDPLADLADVILEDTEGRKEGSFHVIDGKIHQVTDGKLTLSRESKELRALIGLRDAAVALLALESDPDLPDRFIDPQRAKARALYDSYVASFGPLNRGTLTEGAIDIETGEPTRTWRRPALGGFRKDPDFMTVMAIEEFDQSDGAARPAPILVRRVNRHPDPVERVETPTEALAVSLGEGRGVDLARIGGLLALTTKRETLEALGDLVFHNGTAWQSARDYLSGNVREKLASARALAAKSPAHTRNVDALEQVQPRTLGPLDIKVSLGAPWTTAPDVKAFATEVLGATFHITHTPSMGVWEVGQNSYAYGYGSANAEALMTYGTSRMTPDRILDHALNGRSPVIYDEEYNYEAGKSTKTRNAAETIAAEEKLRLMDDRFSTWVWEDDERSRRICAEYNERFNSHVLRRPDGTHLTFPGLAAGINPWQQQRDAVDRIVSTERVLIGHPVGSGKTLETILSAMTLRRFGLAQKPLLTVPNHLLEQVTREAQQAFPTGRFLIASKEDLAKDNRRLFAARCATGDWDLVVMTHGAFGSLPLSPEIEQRWVQEQKAELRTRLRGEDGTGGKGAKAIARAIRALDLRLSKLRDGKNDPDQVTFDHLGVDYLMVDEAHLFRRLDTGSTSRTSGFSSGSSKRATDLLMKIDTLASRHPGKPIVSLFTGTPWSNTLAETWTWQRYLQPEMLEQTGTLNFDAWVASFIKYEAAVEVSPDGSGFRVQRRPVGVKNWQQLRTMLWSVADIVSAESINLERPEWTVHNLVADATPGQKEFVQGLADRADDIRKTRRRSNRTTSTAPEDVKDSMLLVCTDGRKVALDPRLVGIEEEASKLAKVADKMAEIYEDTKDLPYGDSPVPGALQLALCDLGTPHPDDTQTYGRLRTLLIQRGVPAKRIRFVHEAKTDRARAALFADCREGAVSVLLGSTSKVGIGTNIQTRLKAIFHIDAPWTPAEVEQRDGRGLRPKNLNKHIDIYRCVTEGTFDAFTWSALERKAKSFQRLYDTDETITELEDISEVVLSFGEVKALAAGNPLLLDQAKLNAEVQKLRLMRSVHLQGVNRSRRAGQDAARRAIALKDRAERTLEALAETGVDYTWDLTRLQGVAMKLDPSGKKGYQYGRETVYLGGFSLTIRNMTVEFEHKYETIASVDVSKRTLRSGDVAVAKAVAAWLKDWAANAEEQAAAWVAQADELNREAAEYESVAEAAVFADDAKLQQAIAELARIDRLITAEAEDEQPEAQQAA